MIGSGGAAVGVPGGEYTYAVIGVGGSPCAEGECRQIEAEFISDDWSANVVQAAVSYAGAVIATHIYTGYAAPEGIFTDQFCNTPGVAISGGTLRSVGPVNGVTFECIYDDGDFARDEGTDRLAVTLRGTCTFSVNGTAQSSEDTTEVRQAFLDVGGCVKPDPDEPPTSCPTKSDTFVAMPTP